MSEKEDDFPSYINTGSWNLYAVNGGFKVGAERANWKLKKILEAYFTIFHSTSAVKDDYISATGSTTFPLFFCATRYAFLISWMIFVTCMILFDIGGW